MTTEDFKIDCKIFWISLTQFIKEIKIFTESMNYQNYQKTF